MQSVNFEYLRKDWDRLADIAANAELYAHTDPVSSLANQRVLIEQFVEISYDCWKLQRPYRASLADLLMASEFKKYATSPVVTALCLVKEKGNKALHRGEGDQRTALFVLEKTYQIAQWFFLSFSGRDESEIMPYQEPTLEQFGVKTKSELQREKKKLLQSTANQEEQIKQLLEELAKEREKAKITVTSEQADTFKQASAFACNELEFNEAETRKFLIDDMLQAAGWEFDKTVLEEVSVSGQPTVTGQGYVDYVLVDSETELPLAIVEAKKTSVDATKGKTQAKLYADALENQHGKRPVIFYTNGYEIYLWDDKRGYVPRIVYGFYSQESLRYLIATREQARTDLSAISYDTGIAGRSYQLLSIKNVLQHFEQRYRKALIVQATGTGKTRVAIALCKALKEAGWVKRILFLCDRRELRKQAKNAFIEYLPGEPITVITQANRGESSHTIHLATCQTMLDCLDKYDTGYFDLIIADESHRSIYNRYREIFHYFDALQVGLTATPQDLINKDTYSLFECEPGVPTAFYGYDEATLEGYLSTFRVRNISSPLRRKGFKYSMMSEEQRRQVEEQDADPESVEYDTNEVDRLVFNRDSNKRILVDLMKHGIRVKEGSLIGKTIIFARNHEHAVFLNRLFDEIYPQYGGMFCQVIDNYDPRAESLIDEFKDNKDTDSLSIAISVDMLDTGIDVPEIVNLVFAKPVFSKTKFWQMIGRGTRLSKNLFGPGQDKTEFLIFDYWGNFEYFDELANKEDKNTGVTKSLQQRVFENRIALAKIALEHHDEKSFRLAIKLISENIRSLPEKTIAVREQWKNIKILQKEGVLEQFDAQTQSVLENNIAPLMQWCGIAGAEAAWNFDLLCCFLQTQNIKRSSLFADRRDKLIDWVLRLNTSINAVRAKSKTIEQVKSVGFWNNISTEDIETVREELRGVMRYVEGGNTGLFSPKIYDVTEDESKIVHDEYKPKSFGLELVEYKKKAEELIRQLISESTALKKIRAALPVSQSDLDELAALILAQEPGLTLEELKEYYPQSDKIESILLDIVGLDEEIVSERIEEFIQKHHGELNSTQMKFLTILGSFIKQNGRIEIDDLYQSPFTSISTEGIDGVFPEKLADELADIIKTLSP